MATRRILHLLIGLFAITSQAAVINTSNNRFDLNPQRDAESVVEGSLYITHTVTDGVTPIDLSQATNIPLSVIFTNGMFTQSVIRATTTNSPGVMRWYVPFVAQGGYRLTGTAMLPGETIAVFDRFVTVTTTTATTISSALNIYNPTVTQEIAVVVADTTVEFATAPTTVTLANASSATGAVINVKYVSGTGKVVVQTQSGDWIENTTNRYEILYLNSAFSFISDGGTNWYVY